MTEFFIRECCAEDADSLYKINRDSLGYDYPLELTKNKLEKLIESPAEKIFVAVVENKIVGYIHASDYDVIYADHYKNILGIAVDEKYRQNGIGKALLSEAEKWGKETGAVGIRLCSGSTRTEAHLFYRHCGYKNCKEQINFKKTF